MKKNELPTGLVMTGGGARGAYQAGVLKRIGEMKHFSSGPAPFQIISGSSAGSVNGAALATGVDSFFMSTKKLAALWAGLQVHDVFRTDVGSFVPKVSQWVEDLTLGGFWGGRHSLSLFDSSPLRGFLSKHLNMWMIRENINRGFLKSLSMAATDYSTGKTFIFIQGEKGHPLWQKSRRITYSTEITVDHVCASAAIPVVFQPVKLKTSYGQHFFGDGCLRMSTPLSPAIRLGARKLLAIGVRSKKPMPPNNPPEQMASEIEASPSMAQVLGVTLNAIFLDHLDADVEHLERLNGLIDQWGEVDQPMGMVKEPMHKIIPLSISPSVDIGELASTFANRLPPLIRYVMQGLGTKKTHSADLMSYILFDSEFTRTLVNIGYEDASRRIDEIENFFFSTPSKP